MNRLLALGLTVVAMVATFAVLGRNYSSGSAPVGMSVEHSGSRASDQPWAVEVRDTGVFALVEPFDSNVTFEGHSGTIRRMGDGCVEVASPDEGSFVAVWPEGTTVSGRGRDVVIRGDTPFGRFALKLGEQIEFGEQLHAGHLNRWLAKGQQTSCGALPAVLIFGAEPLSGLTTRSNPRQ